MPQSKQKLSGVDLYSVQKILLRAFLVNTLMVLFVWLLTFIQGFIFIGVVITGVSAPMFYISAIGALAVWGLAGVLLFLVPAIAIWWERKVMK